MNRIARAATILAMTAFALLSLGCASRGPVRVAVYADEGAMEPYITAAQDAVRADGMRCERIVADDVRSGALKSYDVVIFPGGTGNGLAASLGEEGGAAVTEFARDGGGVIGVCAGGYLCAVGYNDGTARVELVNARLWDLDNWARGEGTVDIDLARSGTRATLRFENAPVFEPAGREDLPPYETIARFASDPAGTPTGRESIAGHDAIVAAPFGKGRVVLFGPHPELTPGQEHLLQRAVRWTAGRTDSPVD